MNLSKKQKELLRIMRNGWFGEYCVTNSESAYIARDSMKGRRVNISNFNKFEQLGLVAKVKKNFALYQYHLTELGNSIDLNSNQ